MGGDVGPARHVVPEVAVEPDNGPQAQEDGQVAEKGQENPAVPGKGKAFLSHHRITPQRWVPGHVSPAGAPPTAKLPRSHHTHADRGKTGGPRRPVAVSPPHSPKSHIVRSRASPASYNSVMDYEALASEAVALGLFQLPEAVCPPTFASIEIEAALASPVHFKEAFSVAFEIATLEHSFAGVNV